MSRLPSGLRAFLLNPTQTSAAVIHAARLGEQMFSFSSTHGGGALCQRLSGVQSKNPTPGGALSLFSSAPPTSSPNDDVILFRPSSHMAQTGCALLSMWKHFDSHSLPIQHLPLSPSPRRLSGIQMKLQCLFNGIGVVVQAPGSPIWPRTH